MNETNFTLSATFDRQFFRFGGGSVRYLLAGLKSNNKIEANIKTRRPLNIALVIDTSETMYGDKLAAAKVAAFGLVKRLNVEDRISLISFSRKAQVHLDAIEVSPENKRRIGVKISQLRTSRGANLSDGYFTGVERAALIAENQPQMKPQIIVLSDGRTNIGNPDPAKLYKHVGELAQRGVLTSTVAIGADCNAHLLRGMAEYGGGRHYHAESADEISSVLNAEVDTPLQPIIEDTRLHLTFSEFAKVELIGSYPHEISSTNAVVSLGSINLGIERFTVFKITCSEPTLFTPDLEFSISATGKSTANHKQITSKLENMTLFSVFDDEQETQPRNSACAEQVARIWANHIITNTTHFIRRSSLHQANAYIQQEMEHFNRYVDGLNEVEKHLEDLKKMTESIVHRMHYRTHKERYLESIRNGADDHHVQSP